MENVRVRFAPSPTGPPHVGTIHTGLFNWLVARNTGGKFILRIEDTDREREVQGAYEQLLTALKWLGCDWDEGPEAGGEVGPYIQSQRLHLYSPAAEELIEKGGAYRCWCSKERLDQIRERQRAANQPSGYDRHCFRLSDEEIQEKMNSGEPFVVRLKINREGKTGWDDIVRGHTEFENKLIDDQVLLKADGWPTYHLANVVDDHLMGVNLVIRGEDWISSTPKHLMIYEAFGWQPPKFAHVSLLLGADRSKLSKRHGTTNFLEFIEAGYLPEALFNFLAILGWSAGNDQEILTVDEVISKFKIEDCIKSGSVFDYEKLNWMNGHYIRNISIEELTKRCLPFLEKSGLIANNLDTEALSYVQRVVTLEQDRVKLLSEIAPLTDYFFKEPHDIEQASWDKWMYKDHVLNLLNREVEELQKLETWDHDGVESVLRSLITEMEIKASDLIHPTRVAVSGRTVGPGLFEMIAVLGKERTIARINRAIAQLST